MTNLWDVDLNIVVISSKGKETVMLDCGTSEMAQELHRVVGIPARIYISHSHYDHDGGARFFSSMGSEIYASHSTITLLQTSETALESFFPQKHRIYLDNQEVESFVKEIIRQSSTGIDFRIARPQNDDAVEVIEAPGHVNGMQVYRYGNIVFTSDAIQGSGIKGSEYTNSIPQISSFENYFQSLRRIESLKPEAIIPGHNFKPTSSRVVEGSEVDKFLYDSYETAKLILDYAFDALNEDWQSIGSLAKYILGKFSINKIYPQSLITAEATIASYGSIVSKMTEGGVPLYRIY